MLTPYKIFPTILGRGKIVPNVLLNNAAVMRPLTLINTLEYYDVPQILVAADATGTMQRTDISIWVFRFTSLD